MEGTECDADRALLLSGQGQAENSNLTVRDESRWIGQGCDPSDLIFLEEVGMGRRPVDHR